MDNLERILIQYATFNWKDVLKSVSQEYYIVLACFSVLLFVVLCFLRIYSNRRTKTVTKSQPSQTELEVFDSDRKEIFSEFLNHLCNHSVFRDYLLNGWIENFHKLQISKMISKSFKVHNFDERSQTFLVSELNYRDYAENLTVSFRIRCPALSISTSVVFGLDSEVRSCVKISDLDLRVIVIVREASGTASLKFCPESLLNLATSLTSACISEAEKELSRAQFDRDLRVVLMHPVEWTSGQPESFSSSEEPQKLTQPIKTVQDASNQTDEHHFPRTESQSSENQLTTGASSEDWTTEEDDAEEPPICMDSNGCQTCENTLKKSHTKGAEAAVLEAEEMVTPKLIGQNLTSEMSLFTNESFWVSSGEESPFHERFSNILAGRTLVVNLVKVVDLQELKVPVKRGYCVLELDEPYQRHVSHLIPLASISPVWDQHFVFSLNSNSQRLTVELFNTNKKAQNVQSLGAALITMNQIITEQTEHFYPINTNQSQSRKSWRCDAVLGTADCRIAAFVIEFQIMKSVIQPIVDHQRPQHRSEEVLSCELPLTATSLVGLSEEAPASRGQNDSGEQSKLVQNIELKKTPLDEEHRTKVASLRVFNKSSVVTRRPKVISSLKQRFSQLLSPTPITSQQRHHLEKQQQQKALSLSNDCLDQLASSTASAAKATAHIGVPLPQAQAQPEPHQQQSGVRRRQHNHPAPTTRPASKIEKRISQQMTHSRSLSSSLKKIMLNLSSTSASSSGHSHNKEKSIEELFKERDPGTFDTISTEGFQRIMNKGNSTAGAAARYPHHW